MARREIPKVIYAACDSNSEPMDTPSPPPSPMPDRFYQLDGEGFVRLWTPSPPPQSPSPPLILVSPSPPLPLASPSPPLPALPPPAPSPSIILEEPDDPRDLDYVPEIEPSPSPAPSIRHVPRR